MKPSHWGDWMRRALLCVTLIAALAGFWKAGRVNAAAANQQAVNAPQSAAATPSNYVGAETCAICHEDEVKGFDRTRIPSWPLSTAAKA